MRILQFIFLLPLLAACAAPDPTRNISVQEELLQSRNWNLAVLALDYTAIEGQGQSGTVIYQSGGADAGQTIANLLAAEFSKASNINIVERLQMNQLVEEQKLQMSGVINTSTAVEVGQMIGANAVLIGNVSEYIAWSSLGIPGSTVSFSVKMIDVESGQVISSGSISKVERFDTAFQNAQKLVPSLVTKLLKQ